MKKRWIFLLSFLLLVGLSACGKEEIASDRPLVYASFFPVADLVRQVGGENIEVKSFMPTNVDPHLWEPTAKEMKELSKAKVLFINGANMERWVDQVRENLPDLKIVSLAEKVPLISYKGAADLGDFQYMTKIEAKKGETYRFDFGHTHEEFMRVSFLRLGGSQDEKELVATAKEAMKERGTSVPQKETIQVEEKKVYALEMGHVHGEIFFQLPTDGEWAVVSDRVSEEILSYHLMDRDATKELKHEDLVTNSTSSKDKITYDPHSWLSINNAKKYLIEIERTLKEIFPDHAKVFKKASFKSLDQLTTMHAKYTDLFQKLDPGRKEFVVTHYAWEYLAQEFGLKQYPLQGLISMDAPSLRTIKKAVSFCKEKGINTIFNEAHIEPKTAEMLAQEIDGRVVDLNSMEYLQDAEEQKPGAYLRMMEENLDKLYQSMKGGN